MTVMKRHSPCQEGSERFLSCGNRYEVFRTALDPLCTGWLLKSMQEGWGPAVGDIAGVFAGYVNGRVTVESVLPSGRVLKSQMWAGDKDAGIQDGVTRVVLMGFTGKLTVGRRYGFLEVYAGPGTDTLIDFAGDGIMLLRPFGGTVRGKGCRIRTLGGNAPDKHV